MLEMVVDLPHPVGPEKTISPDPVKTTPGLHWERRLIGVLNFGRHPPVHALTTLHNTRRVGNDKGSRWAGNQHENVRGDVRLDIINV